MKIPKMPSSETFIYCMLIIPTIQNVINLSLIQKFVTPSYNNIMFVFLPKMKVIQEFVVPPGNSYTNLCLLDVTVVIVRYPCHSKYDQITDNISRVSISIMPIDNASHVCR